MAIDEKNKTLTASLWESIHAVRGTRMQEAEDDDDEKKKDEEGAESDEEEAAEHEEGGSEEGEEGEEGEDAPPADLDLPAEDELGTEDAEGEEDLEPVGDLSLEDDSDIPTDFAGEPGEMGDLGMGDGEFPSDEESPEDLLADEPPGEEGGEPFEETPGEEGLEKSSDIREFVTNQLIDFPVEDVEFEEQEGAKYIDAKFGDKAVSFCLYTSEDGQPLFAILYDNEVHRIELAPEAVTGDGMVRDEFMPVDWIRDHLSRIVDVAPEFEAFRMTRHTKRCSEVRTVMVRVSESSIKRLREASAIAHKKMSKPKTMKKGKVNSGPAKPAPHKKAPLGGQKIKPATKSGGKPVMK